MKRKRSKWVWNWRDYKFLVHVQRCKLGYQFKRQKLGLRAWPLRVILARALDSSESLDCGLPIYDIIIIPREASGRLFSRRRSWLWSWYVSTINIDSKEVSGFLTIMPYLLGLAKCTVLRAPGADGWFLHDPYRMPRPPNPAHSNLR